ncbi:MAG: hypothetical protein EA397_11885 [Deltaproteobacteria bacterium]|nr:MAG: hypothetical protein EA397_11885 [Deltaproteobacteria bacterium]
MISLLLLASALAAEGDEPTPQPTSTGSAIQSSEDLTPVRPQPFTGSYGRVQASTDFRGGRGSGSQIATWGPRLQLGPYLELDVGWDATLDDGTELTILVTPAVTGDVFHYTGNFDSIIALRNLYAELRQISGTNFSAWVGSRMYRGDDIYLLDFWPLDNLNTYGGGGALDIDRTRIAAQVGVNRLVEGEWQVQDALVARLGRVEGERVLVLDRQRSVASLTAEQRIPIGDMTLRLKAYGEYHAMPSGTRLVDDGVGQRTPQDLPSDRGMLVGGQISLWGWAQQSFVHLWVRHSTGLAAIGELTVPESGFDSDLRVRSERRTLLALTGNTEHGWFGFQWAGYTNNVYNAEASGTRFDDRFEAVGVLRPNLWIGKHGALSVELSQQFVRPRGLNPRTGRHDQGGITQVSLIPAIQAAPGAYTRPRLQVVYTYSRWSEGALNFLNPQDVRFGSPTQHYVGLGAEWWIHSRRVVVPE